MPSVPNQRRAGKNLDNLPSSAPEDTVAVPVRFQDDETRSEIFRFLVQDLVKRNMMSSTFAVLLEDMADNIARLHEIQTDLDDQGTTIERRDEDGNLIGSRENPKFKQMMTLKRSITVQIEKLGMSPRDIVFLARADPTPDDIVPATNATGDRIVYFDD